MVEFRFTNEHQSSEVGNVVTVLRNPRLWIPSQQDYPDYDQWLLKTESDIAAGSKRAMLAYMGQKPVGAIVYQEDAGRLGVINIRNISVSPDTQGRYIGSFLLRNTEIEGSQNDFPGCHQMTVDTKATNTNMINFLLAAGYQIQAIKDLYGLGAGLDALLAKPLGAVH